MRCSEDTWISTRNFISVQDEDFQAKSFQFQRKAFDLNKLKFDPEKLEAKSICDSFN